MTDSPNRYREHDGDDYTAPRTLTQRIFEPITTQWKGPGRTLLIIKVVVFCIAYSFMIINALHNIAQPKDTPECLNDIAHSTTADINEYLKTAPGMKKALLITSSLLVDIVVIVCALSWIVYCKNYKLFWAVLTLGAFKIANQKWFYLRTPPGYIWEYPGFPSLTTPSYKTTDFFFSGQVALVMIAFFHFRALNFNKWKWFSVFVLFYESFAILVTQAHYVIDVATAIVAAHYFFMMGTWIDVAISGKKENGLQSPSSAPTSGY